MVDLREVKEILEENIRRCDELLASNVKFIEETFNNNQENKVMVRYE